MKATRKTNGKHRRTSPASSGGGGSFLCINKWRSRRPPGDATTHPKIASDRKVKGKSPQSKQQFSAMSLITIMLWIYHCFLFSSFLFCLVFSSHFVSFCLCSLLFNLLTNFLILINLSRTFLFCVFLKVNLMLIHDIINQISGTFFSYLILTDFPWPK